LRVITHCEIGIGPSRWGNGHRRPTLTELHALNLPTSGRTLVLATLVAIGALTTSCALTAPSGAPGPCQRNASVACMDIDGYPVGSLALDCGPEGAACGDVALLARLALDAREPNHPEITSVQQFEPDLSKICGRALCTFTSFHAIVVFTFANGQHHATGYECGGVGTCGGTLRWNGEGIPKPTPR
jgi:hypothetical protein